MTPADRWEQLVRARFAPPPRLSVSEWADRYRVLVPESSAEPGPWRTVRAPYLKEPMDAYTDPAVETLVVMASSQSGKTEVALNAMGRSIHLDPGPTLWVAPNVDPMARATSKDRITPMFRTCAPLVERAAPLRGRSGSATILHRTFTGGHLTIAGANAPAGLASRPIRYLYLDEVDRYKESAGGEGDPIALAVARTRTFTRRKIVVVSSPTVEGDSKIEDWYAVSDQRRYWLPCPRCGEFFVPKWADVRWENRAPETAHVVCPVCLGRIEDHERAAMVAAGQWRAGAPFSGVAGFHIWEFYAPWRSLREIVKQFLESLGSVELMKTFVNTVEGRSWRPPAESIEPAHLLERREAYPAATLPEGVGALFAGIDTQDDRLELLLAGVGAGEETWILDRSTFLGDPGKPDVWAEVDEFLRQPWTLAGGGRVRALGVFVDAGGHKTQGVYSAVVSRQRGYQAVPGGPVWCRWIAGFGRDGGLSGQLVSMPAPLKTSAGTVYRRLVDSHQAKVILYARLKITAPGPERVHFPVGLGPEFFDELTAERLVTRRNRLGVPHKVWEQVREANHSLDCYVYAMAALRARCPTPAHLARLLAAPPKEL